MRRGIGSHSEPQTIRIQAELRNKRHDQTAIMIWDGQMEPSGLPHGSPIHKMIWIDVDKITDQSWEYLTDLACGDQIEFWIPEWYATKKGLV